jgi:hypothetical protein
MGGNTVVTSDPSVADYRATSPKTGEGRLMSNVPPLARGLHAAVR